MSERKIIAFLGEIKNALFDIRPTDLYLAACNAHCVHKVKHKISFYPTQSGLNIWVKISIKDKYLGQNID